MKKAIGYFLVAIFVVASLVFVYFFLTKGYSSEKVDLSKIKQDIVNEISPPKVEESGNVTSSKISLVVTSPLNGATLGSTNATVKGKTSPQAEVFVNDQEGTADINGNFSVNVGLDEGINQIVVLANDADGNAAEQDLTVTVVSFE
jgi:hypothetical protein